MKKHFFLSIASILFFLSCLVSYVSYVDADAIFRLSPYHTSSIPRQRYIRAGMLKYADYELAIIGSSTCHNILSDEAARLWGIPAINASMSGSSAYEQRELMRLALEKDSTKIILFAMDFYTLTQDSEYSPVGLNGYVYHQHYFDLLPYFLNYSTLKDAYQAYQEGQKSNWLAKVTNFWKMEENREIDSRGVSFLDPSYVTNVQHLRAIRKIGECDTIAENYQNLLHLFASCPGVEFYVFFPPYLHLWWLTAENEGKIDSIIELKKEMVRKAAGLSNVRFYDFQTDAKRITNFAHFCDVVHTSPRLGNEILEALH